MTSRPPWPPREQHGVHPSQIRLGLRENLAQFSLLVLVNAFVGGMVGLERTVVPLGRHRGVQDRLEVVVFSFIITFGLVKAGVNLVSGLLADRFTRKTVLVAGWIVRAPVPFMLGYGPSWAWIVAANVLLGISQGLAWSMTVTMKIDLVGPRQRARRWDSTRPPAMAPWADRLYRLPGRAVRAPARAVLHRDRLFRAGSAVRVPRTRHARACPSRGRHHRAPGRRPRLRLHASSPKPAGATGRCSPSRRRARQQPERRHVVGRVSAAVRGERHLARRRRSDQGGVPGDLGRGTDLHRLWPIASDESR